MGEAVSALVDDKNLLRITGRSIYTPMLLNGAWEWMAFSEPDGILACNLSVNKGVPAKPTEHSEVLACVFIESEESTSNSLLNPWGKGCLPSIPNGVWIDIKKNKERRRHMVAHTHVLFITPEPTDAKALNTFKRRKSILERVEAAAADASLLVVKKGAGNPKLAESIWEKAKAHLTRK